jgi:hypothetical protein
LDSDLCRCDSQYIVGSSVNRRQSHIDLMDDILGNCCVNAKPHCRPHHPRLVRAGFLSASACAWSPSAAEAARCGSLAPTDDTDDLLTHVQ